MAFDPENLCYMYTSEPSFQKALPRQYILPECYGRGKRLSDILVPPILDILVADHHCLRSSTSVRPNSSCGGEDRSRSYPAEGFHSTQLSQSELHLQQARSEKTRAASATTFGPYFDVGAQRSQRH